MMEKILIIEDSALQTRVLVDMLVEHDFVVDCASDGASAIEKLERGGGYDLLLMDMVLPDMSGLGLLKKITKLNLEFKPVIIALSGVTDKENIVESLGLGIDDYMTKPYHPLELLARINNHLERRQAIKKLAQINHANDKFLMVMGHDLKDSFTSLYSSIHLLDKISNQLERQDLLTTAKINAKQIVSLLDSLLLWGRMVNGGLLLKREPIDLNEIVMKTVEQFNGHFEAKGVRADCEVNGEAIIYADRFMMETVIRNIISNAIKFTMPGKTISINSTKEFEYGEEVYEVCISDSGIGMTEERAASLFNGHYNSVEPDTEGNKGVGLGLSICKEFIQKNRGKIEVYSKLGEGSNFIISMPKASNVVL